MYVISQMHLPTKASHDIRGATVPENLA